MPIPLDAPEVLDREFLEIRAKLLQIAASLDRMDRADGSNEQDPRVEQLQRAIGVLAGSRPERAESLQLIFSIAYDDDWRGSYFPEKT